jgi:hypothetical protein
VIEENRIGIIRYDKNDIRDPFTPPPSTQHPGYGCRDPPPEKLTPIVPRKVGKDVNGMSEADYLKIGLQYWPNITDTTSRLHKWTLINKTQLIDWREPSLKKFALNQSEELDANSSPIYLDYDTGEWVYFVIMNNYTLASANTPRTIPRSVHPIHLHGHDFVILAQGDGVFTKDVLPNLDNPARRDVANCPIGGYLWIAFKIDNPGAWLMHCHIAFHASSGLSLQFIEQRDRIKGLMETSGALPQLLDRCEQWKEHYDTVNILQGVVQNDSGI